MNLGKHQMTSHNRLCLSHAIS